jgi:hypothetical protein
MGGWLLAAVCAGTGCSEASAPLLRGGFYAAADGSSQGDGSREWPWDLQTALAGGRGTVQPGDTVWVLGGRYRGAFISVLSGKEGAPIVVRQYPGHRAVLDGAGSPRSTLLVRGAWSVLWGLEVTNSDLTRWTASSRSDPRANSVVNEARHTKYINLIIHDGGVAFYNYPHAVPVEISGCIIYNNGWVAPDRGHGHGLYLKSEGGLVLALGNILFGQFGYGIHVYSDRGSGALQGIHLEGNVAFNNGPVEDDSQSANLLVGGQERADDVNVMGNRTYLSAGNGGANVRLGYQGVPNGSIQATQNTFAGGSPVLELGWWSAAAVRANELAGTGTVVELRDPGLLGGIAWEANRYHRDPGQTAWKIAGQLLPWWAWRHTTGLGETDEALPGAPVAPTVFVRADPYEPGRAIVTVYNWGEMPLLTVDLSGVLSAGDLYEVRNVQDLFGEPVAAGVYDGQPVLLGMAGVEPAVPVGLERSLTERTAPAFDVFVVTRRRSITASGR